MIEQYIRLVTDLSQARRIIGHSWTLHKFAYTNLWSDDFLLPRLGYATEGMKVFRFDFQPMEDLICLNLGAAIFIERALAIVHQCNDHTDKRSLEHSHC